MSKLTPVLALMMVGLWGIVRGQEARTLTFDGDDALAGWTVTGDVTVDATKGRDGKGGALKVGPGGVAMLKLRDTDGAG
ncbi:MAG TPA: hypothetical protein P5532_19650 [Planctomycetota bacterium]|nr:hypothetical protein [Planctomycetota bacterium]